MPNKKKNIEIESNLVCVCDKNIRISRNKKKPKHYDDVGGGSGGCIVIGGRYLLFFWFDLIWFEFCFES